MIALATNTDFLSSTNSPEKILRLISEAGFTHLHWCHQWCTDFQYSRSEIAQIKQWLKTYGLKLLDIHGSTGKEKWWCAAEEYRRQAGVELAVNRMVMFSELEGEGALMMHVPCAKIHTPAECDAMMRTFEDLLPHMQKYGCRVACENMNGYDEDYVMIDRLLAAFPEKWVGLTYDSGHGNFPVNMIDYIDARKNRLMALHLNDNDGTQDQHQPAFYGTVDWNKIARIIQESPYTNPLSFEVSMHCTPFFDRKLADKGEPQMDADVLEALKDHYQRALKVRSLIPKYN